MTRTDDQVAALRAFLTSEADEGVRLTRQLVETNRAEGIGELVYAAFVTAVRRRFLPTGSIPDVIHFVATARVRLLDKGITIDPRTAEILLRRILGENIAAGLDEKARARAQVFLLSELVSDEELDAAGLSGFLAQARALADQLIV